jgi:serine phosphatase RsbU (regulator of sigma subunit)
VIRICTNRITLGVPAVPRLPAGPPGNATIVYMRSRDTWDAVTSMRTGLSSAGGVDSRGPASAKMEEAMSRILLEESLPRACEAVLSHAERLVPFDRCLIIAIEGGAENSRVIASRVRAGPGIEVAVSRAILQRVVREHEAVVVSSREDVQPTQSFVRSGARCALCVPLISGGRVHGVIYLERRDGPDDLSRRDADSIGPLAGLLALKLASSRLEEERRTSERIGKDLELARSIQESLLPRERVERQGFSIEGFASPCYEVGGDYFDVIPRQDGTIIVVIGDVSGKGLSSALYMACVRSALRAHAEAGLGPGDILARLSKSAAETFRPDHFITLFVAMLDPRTGVLAHGNAGHLPALGIDPGGTAYELEATDPAINLIEWNAYTIRERTLRHGELLLLYTDGLMEAEGPGGEQYGTERLRACLAACSKLPLAEIRKRIFDEVEAFSERKHPEDDRTLVLVRRELPEAAP